MQQPNQKNTSRTVRIKFLQRLKRYKALSIRAKREYRRRSNDITELKEEKSSYCKPRIRVMCDKKIAFGPGKANLLEAIEEMGSISSAARKLGLSYRRAWEMVDTMNHCFKKPLVTGTIGGKAGGGTNLTMLGKSTVSLYRTMENKARKASKKEWKTLQKRLKPV